MKTHFNVVVPLYNADEWVLRNLKTLKAQNYDNFSVVYVNDASSDNSKEIIEDLVVAAHNNAKSKLKQKTSEEISKVTGGISLPPGFKLPF